MLQGNFLSWNKSLSPERISRSGVQRRRGLPRHRQQRLRDQGPVFCWDERSAPGSRGERFKTETGRGGVGSMLRVAKRIRQTAIVSSPQSRLELASSGGGEQDESSTL
ncbi:hypothetical protein EMPG_09391 [Blastomyces silverae]|uniref:Uncharacterized protein n=1 Tax=Blastomyces silverae TaxID=2060906 RepID=A0A0H1BR81_9EURO|nr:hypothetical protein EMPG_09391 [Blastomyces silverae]